MHHEDLREGLDVAEIGVLSASDNQRVPRNVSALSALLALVCGRSDDALQ